MSEVRIFWDPDGFEVDNLKEKEYQGISDGDTPLISMPIRMLSTDTPEIHHRNEPAPDKIDEQFHQLADWIKGGETARVGFEKESALARHLLPRLTRDEPATSHFKMGDLAKEYLEKLIVEKITKGDARRGLFVSSSNEHFDQYKRLLAYVAPDYSRKEREKMTPKERATFNFLMVEAGWAAPFVIFPSLPKYSDLVMLFEAGKNAYERRLGAWSDPENLTGYEFRMCTKIYEKTKEALTGKKEITQETRKWIQRYCADMATLEVFLPADYIHVEPYRRIFIWPKDVNAAVAAMHLVPARIY